ncbi:universal stress protein [Chloroflexi bacterium TSY]|nr:universal stress protein [Chloroflexi bacterium TSY]
MYKNILVPLDGSKRAEAIMPHVEEMAHRYEAKVILMQVVEPVYDFADAYGDINTFKRIQEETRQRAEDAKVYLAGWRGILVEKGISASVYTTFGPIVYEILNMADREKVDMIAMASHGRTGLARAFYGSVAAGILHRTGLPLLIVRAENDQ